MSDITLFHVTFPSKAEAERVAEALLAERLIACANVHAPCTSIYRWEGRTERAEEIPAVFKTRSMLATRLRARIEELHSYELPVIESWSAAAGELATAWISAETA